MTRTKRGHVRGRPRLPADERRDVQVATRLDDATVERIDAIGGALGGWPAGRTEIVRTAARLGLDSLERDPFLVVEQDAEWAEWILGKCWLADGQLGGAEKHVTGDCVVYLWPEIAQDTRSRVSFRAALEKLAAKKPPVRPLPWVDTTQQLNVIDRSSNRRKTSKSIR